MIVRLTFPGGMDVEYEAEAVEVQTIDPVHLCAAAHGFGVVISEPTA